MDRTPAPPTVPAALAGALRAAWFWRLALLLLVCAVTWLALTPHPEQYQDRFIAWDKLNHLLAFAALTVAGALGFVGARVRVAAGMFAFGVLIEVLQSFTPNRSASGLDLLADVLGIAAGFVVAQALLKAAARFVLPR